MAGYALDTLLDEPFYSGGTTVTPTPTITVGGSYDVSFDEPFAGGAATALANDLVPNQYQVAINGHPYLIDPAKFQEITVPIRRQSADESVEPGEQTMSTEGPWPRAQDNWFLGAGQEFMDNRFSFLSVYVHSGQDPSVRTRYWRSKGVDPWTEGALSLLPEMTRQRAFVSTGTFCAAVTPYVYLWDGTNLWRITNPASATPTYTAISPPSGMSGGVWTAPTGHCTDGVNLYLACGTYGVVQVAGTTATFLRVVPPAPTVVVNGTPGTTHYTYQIVATDANGYKSRAGTVTTITTGNATLSSTNFNEVSWAAVAGAVSYDVVRGGNALVANTTGLSFADVGAATTGYVLPTATTDNFPADFVGYGNGWLVAGAANRLCSVPTTGMTTKIMDHPNPAAVWKAACGGPVAIYVSATAGDRSDLFGVQLSTTTFALGAPFTAGQVMQGETINALTYFEGLVMVATSVGIRAMQDQQQNGFLTSGPVVTDPGAVQCLASWGAFCWWGWSNFNTADDAITTSITTSGLGRSYINEFSNPVQPAYATDVMTPDGLGGTTSSCCVLEGRAYFTVDGLGYFCPSGNLVASGWLESGWVRYGTTESKTLISTDMRFDPLEGSIALQVIPWSSPGEVLELASTPGTTQPPAPWTGDFLQGEQFMVVPTLYRSSTDATKGPTLRRWLARAYVLPTSRQDQIVLPILWKQYDFTPMGDGSMVSMDLNAEWDFLKAIERSGDVATVQIGTRTILAMIDQIELQGEKWSDDKTAMTGTLSVKILTAT